MSNTIPLGLLSPEAQGAGGHTPGLDRAAEAMTGGLLVYDNFAVYALAGNALNRSLQEDICRIKGDARGTTQPLGWTRPFDARTLSTFDIAGINDRDTRELLRDPDEMTALLGGLAFVRGAADMSAKETQGIPDSVIPPDSQTVQVYSPEGVNMTHVLIEAAIKNGSEPVMTSANISGQPETIYETDALAFAEQSPTPLAVAIHQKDEDKPDRPRGSYPIIEVTSDRFRIIRTGCFDPEILQAVMHEYTVTLDPNHQKSKYPHNVLRMSDLPKDVQELRGPELRLGMLAALNWS